MRSAHSNQPERRTHDQFVSRQKMHHSTNLWTLLKWAGTPMIPAQPTAYNRFLSLMSNTEAVFLPKNSLLYDATLLLPDIPLSEGTMPSVKQHLGEVAGSPALITNLTRGKLHKGDELILYTLRQAIENKPTLRFSRRKIMPDEMTETADGLALISDEFADNMKGWALIHVRDEQWSTQTAVTRCTYYKKFTTEEALLTAADSFGGLTPDV